MYKCNMGYSVGDNDIPPERCHCETKYGLDRCKQCDNYNTEYDLIERAIESAKCRIYRQSMSCEDSFAYQKKVENQVEIMKVTIRALEFYRDKLQ